MPAQAELSIPVAISAAAATIAQGLSAEEIGLLAAVFTQLGDTLATIAVLRAAETASSTKQKSGRGTMASSC